MELPYSIYLDPSVVVEIASGASEFIPGFHWGSCCSSFSFMCGIIYHHSNSEFESRSWRGELDTILCDKVCQ